MDPDNLQINGLRQNLEAQGLSASGTKSELITGLQEEIEDMESVGNALAELFAILEEDMNRERESLDFSTISREWFLAAENDDVEEIQRILENSPKANIVEEKDENGFTALYLASMENSEGVVRALLKAGANPDVVGTAEKTTPLFWAVIGDNLELARSLINAKANVNICAECGNSPLHTAAKYNRKEIALLLINEGALLKKCNKSGQTPLQRAQEHKNIDMIVLLEHAERSGIILKFNVADFNGENENFEETIGAEERVKLNLDLQPFFREQKTQLEMRRGKNELESVLIKSYKRLSSDLQYERSKHFETLKLLKEKNKMMQELEEENVKHKKAKSELERNLAKVVNELSFFRQEHASVGIPRLMEQTSLCGMDETELLSLENTLETNATRIKEVRERARFRRMKEQEQSCCVCLDSENPKAVVLLPCKHLCVCKECANKITECPLDHVKIQERLNVFL